ncbi:hypothetical protein GGI35DRAFT_461394 [Trichoderma velutinum]
MQTYPKRVDLEMESSLPLWDGEWHPQQNNSQQYVDLEEENKALTFRYMFPEKTLQEANPSPSRDMVRKAMAWLNDIHYLNDSTNTGRRSSEHEREERWWHRPTPSQMAIYKRSYIEKWKRITNERQSLMSSEHLAAQGVLELPRSIKREEKERQLLEQEGQRRKRSELFTAITNKINDLTASTESKRTEDFSSGEKEFYVAGSVGGIVVEALPDTGAEACFISSHLTSRLGLHPIPGPQKWITLANKKAVKSPGMVTVPWKFSKERDTHTVKCWILPGCVSDLVLGNGFLRATNALKKVCHRIKSKLLGTPKLLQLSYLGNEKQRLRGYLNGHLTAALPDTGSDVMLINGAYARGIGLEVDSNIGNRGTIRLADGSTAVIGGIVRDVEWRVGSATVQCNFYVLENLCVDVILSNNYLFEMNIFSEQEEYFFNINSDDDFEDDNQDYVLYFCILSIETKMHDSMLTLQELKVREKLEELYRRDKARDEIMALPEDQREAASKIENARQQLWEIQKSEREAKWIAELHMATGNVQNGVSRGSWWKKKGFIGWMDKESK